MHHCYRWHARWLGESCGRWRHLFHLQDIIVHPNYQRKGIGKIIVAELLNYVDTVSGKNTHIGLMSSKGREKFYTAFGFVERPTEKFGAGMIKIKN
jgi:GNAT superfamily N-acetyltransferase